MVVITVTEVVRISDRRNGPSRCCNRQDPDGSSKTPESFNLFTQDSTRHLQSPPEYVAATRLTSYTVLPNLLNVNDRSAPVQN